MNNRLFAAVWGAILILFLVAIAMVLGSNAVFLSARDEGLWGMFLAGLRDPANHFAVKLSVITAAVTATLSLVVGIPAAYILSRYRLPGSGLIDTVLDLPIVLPPPVMGISLLIFFNTCLGCWVDRLTPGWYVALSNRFFSVLLGRTIQDSQSWVYSTRGIVLAQFFVSCSFGIRAIKAILDTIGVRHEEVARTLGCTRRQAVFSVVLPMARAGIMAGLVMTWARAIAEFGPILFFCGAREGVTSVMPIQMFLHFSVGDVESAVALVLIMLSISTVTLLTFKRLGGRGYLW